MDVPEEVMQQLSHIQSALEDVDEHLQPFLEAGPKEIAAQCTPLERLKAHLALAQAAVVLYSLDQQLDAAKLEGHPIAKELERLAKYERKVQEAAAADDLARTKPGASLNIDAANRFIDAAIPDLTPEQKAALRARNKRPAAEAATAAAAAAGQDGPSAKQAKAQAQDSAGGRGAAGPQRGSSRGSRQQGQQRGKAPSAGVDADAFLQELVAELGEPEDT